MRASSASCIVCLVLTAMAAPAAARTPQPAAAPKSHAPPRAALTTDQVLARSWAGDGSALSEHLAGTPGQPTRDDGVDAFAAERAAIRACQGERYTASRDGLLGGPGRPLRDC